MARVSGLTRISQGRLSCTTKLAEDRRDVGRVAVGEMKEEDVPFVSLVLFERGQCLLDEGGLADTAAAAYRPEEPASPRRISNRRPSSSRRP